MPLVRVAGPLHRVHRVSRAPLFFGTTGDNRFDDPRRAFGVLYAGESEACAFIETFAEPLDVPFVTLAQLCDGGGGRSSRREPREVLLRTSPRERSVSPRLTSRARVGNVLSVLSMSLIIASIASRPR